MPPPPRDRLAALLNQHQFNGIDFVEIASPDQCHLVVHFLNDVALQGTVTAATITGGDTIAQVAVIPINNAADWGLDANVPPRPLLHLAVAAPGDFSTYTLNLASPALDRYFAAMPFSFKAHCPSDLDCEPPPAPCVNAQGDMPPIDYLAKDFLSFRKALLDFSALRYPEWQERSEADFGLMFLEALSGLADELSYSQDRIAGEATLDSATQRRSLVRHARLVDYEPRPAVAAQVLLQFDVQAPLQTIGVGQLVAAQLPDAQPVWFETGSLIDPSDGTLNQASYPVNPLWNRNQLLPYWWDDSRRCLPAGSTELWLQGHALQFFLGQTLLIESAPALPGGRPVREVIAIARFEELVDPLFGAPPPAALTRLVLVAPTTQDHDLTVTALSGNLVPASQGRRVVNESFAIDQAPAAQPGLALAVARTGANDTPEDPSIQYLYTLNATPVSWLSTGDSGAAPLPELLLERIAPSLQPWIWRRTLIEAEPFEPAFTLDAATFARMGRDFTAVPMQDYAGDAGFTLRFGDGVFGGMPSTGEVYRLIYRVGAGASGNVPADTIVQLAPNPPAGIRAVNNPFPASGGLDAETDLQVQRRAPEDFRAVQYRAVLTRDFVQAMQTLPWVVRSGAVYRWTGSWPTLFATAEPVGAAPATVVQQLSLVQLLNRYRLAGYEAYAPAPEYVALDLYIKVCATPDAFAGEVAAALLAALGSRPLPAGGSAFFQPDRFQFGAPLERSVLEAAIQQVEGVAGVTSIQVRQRGISPVPQVMGETVAVGPRQIIRVDNDPDHPEHGSLHVEVDGGK